jgi:hypothetical protein
MTMQEFTQLDEIEQMSAIMQFGRLMAENTEEDKRTFLYLLGSFYVAASYLQDSDQLCEINCFLEVNQLIPHYRKHQFITNPAEREF